MDKENTLFPTQMRDYDAPSLSYGLDVFCKFVFYVLIFGWTFLCTKCWIHINIMTPLFPTLNPPDQLEPWQLPADLCLRGQDREALGCWCRYSRYNFQYGHWSGRPAAGLPVAEGLSPWHLLVRIHQLSGQEQPWPAHTHHQGRTLKCLWKLFHDIAKRCSVKLH